MIGLPTLKYNEWMPLYTIQIWQTRHSVNMTITSQDKESCLHTLAAATLGKPHTNI